MIQLVEDVRTEHVAPGCVLTADVYDLTSFDISLSSPNVDLVSKISTIAGTVSTSLVPAVGALGLAVWGARWLQVTMGQNLYAPFPSSIS